MSFPKFRFDSRNPGSPDQQHADWEYACFQLLLKEIREMKASVDPIAAQLAALTTQVAANVTVEQSAITLIQGIAAALAASANDPAAIAALGTQLSTSAQALSAAISANTPAAPVTP